MTDAEELELLELEAESAKKTSAPKTESISKLESGLRGAGQGATLGFSDELIAGGRNIGNLVSGENKYEELLKEERAKNQLARLANPATYGLSELGGGLATTFVPGIGLAKGAGLAKTIGSSVALGALSGAGHSDSDIEGASKAALTSGLVSGALGAGGYGLAKGLRSIAPRLAETATGATGKELTTKFQPGSGEKLLERGTVGWFSTPKSVAEKSASELANASDDIGNSLGNINDISKSQILANLHTERARLLENEANAGAVKKIDKIITEFGKSEPTRSAQDIWNVKKSYEDMVNWLARKTKPNTTQSNEIAARALRNAVTDVAESQSPELAAKFADERKLYSLYKPILEAAERKAATIQQRDIGGLLDTIAVSGGIAGDLVGDKSGKGTITGIGLAGLRRGVVPRLPAFLARTAYNPLVQQTALRLPVSAYTSLLGEKK